MRLLVSFQCRYSRLQWVGGRERFTGKEAERRRKKVCDPSDEKTVTRYQNTQNAHNYICGLHWQITHGQTHTHSLSLSIRSYIGTETIHLAPSALSNTLTHVYHHVLFNANVEKERCHRVCVVKWMFAVWKHFATRSERPRIQTHTHSYAHKALGCEANCPISLIHVCYLGTENTLSTFPLKHTVWPGHTQKPTYNNGYALACQCWFF